jgi:putative transposase
LLWHPRARAISGSGAESLRAEAAYAHSGRSRALARPDAHIVNDEKEVMNSISPPTATAAVSIPIGTKFILMSSGAPRCFEVKKEGKLEITAQDLETLDDEQFRKRDMIDWWHGGTLKFLHWAHSADALLSRSAALSVQDFEALPEPKRREMLIKHKLMQRMEKSPDEKGCVTKAVAQAVSADAKPLYPDVLGLSASNLHRLYHDLWRPSGGHIMSLLPKTHLRGNYGDRFAEEVMEIFLTFVHQHYLKTSRPTKEEVYSAFVAYIDKLNAKRSPDLRIRAPQLSTFKKWIKTRLDPYEVAEKRYGKAHARKKCGGFGHAEQATRPLELVECDHSPIDLQLISEMTGLPCGRAWLTVLIDVYSRCIIGFYISFDPPSYFSVAQALLHAILRKDYLKRLHPTIKNEWRCFGLPERLICDNGAEFHSEDFERLCAVLGIALEFTQKRTPQHKPYVERVLGTINGVFKNMPSTTHANYMVKGEHRPERYATVSKEKVEAALTRWIVDVYHQRIHRGLKGIPDRTWQKGAEVFPPRLPSSIEDLRIIMGRHHQRVLRHDGIVFETIRYTASVEDMRSIRSHPNFPKGGLVDFTSVDSDCSQIHVKHPEGRGCVEFRAQHHAQLEGVSFYQYHLLRKVAEEDLHREADWEGIKAAREYVRRELGFYDRKRRRRLTRAETRVESAVSRETSEVENMAGRKPSRARSKTRNTEKPEGASNLTSHREGGKGWGSRFRKVS